jgi:hypothetical protein
MPAATASTVTVLRDTILAGLDLEMSFHSDNFEANVARVLRV